MADISKITLPSGNTYDFKDAVAREAIAGGVSFIIAWDGNSTPVVADIPYGVTVTYQGTDYTGTLSAETTGSGTHAQAGAFYLVKSSTQPSSQTLDKFDEYVPVGTTGSKYWEKIGDTEINLTDVVTGVTLTKATDVVLGEDTTFTNSTSSVSFSGGTSDKVLGTDTTFTGTATGGDVALNSTYIKATASSGGAAWNNKDSKTVVTGYASPSTDSAASSVSPTTKALETTTITGTNGTESVSKVTKTASKLVTTSVPNVTAAGSASTWNFSMGSGDNAETLIISGANSTAPTLGTAITAATGAVDANGTGSDIVTGVTISDKTVAKAASSATRVATGETVASDSYGDNVVTNVAVGDTVTVLTGLGTPSTASVIGASSTFTNTQPTITLAKESSSATGRVQVVDGKGTVTQPTITVSAGSDDEVTTITGLGTGTAAAQTITVGTNDKVTAVKDSGTSISVTKGNA